MNVNKLNLRSLETVELVPLINAVMDEPSIFPNDPDDVFKGMTPYEITYAVCKNGGHYDPDDAWIIRSWDASFVSCDDEGIYEEAENNEDAIKEWLTAYYNGEDVGPDLFTNEAKKVADQLKLK